MKHLFIGSTTRSGGSLLARLFDHHPDVASYPFEFHLPMDRALHPSLQRRGEKNHVQDFPVFGPDSTPEQRLLLARLDRDPARCEIGRHFAEGRLEGKTRDVEIRADFDHAAFHSRAVAHAAADPTLRGLYDGIHRAFFATWDRGAHQGTLRFVAYHRADGLFADVERFLASFDGVFIQPVRSLEGCVESEKQKVLSQVMTGKVLGGRMVPRRLLKNAYGRFLENAIVDWLVTFTRSVILKERLGERYLVLRFEDLLGDVGGTMRRLAAAAGVPWHDSLLQPTNAGIPWTGNSMFGAAEGVDARLAESKGLLGETERRLVERYAGPLLAWLNAQRGGFLDYATLDRTLLFDYEHQARFYPNRDKTALYLASLYERWRYRAALDGVLQLFRGKAKSWYL